MFDQVHPHNMYPGINDMEKHLQHLNLITFDVLSFPHTDPHDSCIPTTYIYDTILKIYLSDKLPLCSNIRRGSLAIYQPHTLSSLLLSYLFSLSCTCSLFIKELLLFVGFSFVVVNCFPYFVQVRLFSSGLSLSVFHLALCRLFIGLYF